MSEFPLIPLPPDAKVGDEVVVSSESNGAVWHIVSTNGAKTRRRMRCMKAGTPPVEPPPPPPPSPPTGTVVSPGADIKAMLAQGVRSFVLRGGTYKLQFGSADSPYRDVSMSAYPGEVPVIDGEGVQSFLYIGTQSGTWRLTDLTIRNFLPEDQGVIGIGDSCRLEMTRVKMIGSGVPSGNNDHGIYFHGTGTGKFVDLDVSQFPGAALQTYRGTPSVEVVGGKYHGLYVGSFVYSGSVTFNGADIRGSGVWDVDCQRPATVTLANCTGRGSDGKPKVTVHT